MEVISKECNIPDKLSCTATTKIELSEHLFQLCTAVSAGSHFVIFIASRNSRREVFVQHEYLGNYCSIYEYVVLHAKNPSIHKQFYGSVIHHLPFFSFISFNLLG